MTKKVLSGTETSFHLNHMNELTGLVIGETSSHMDSLTVFSGMHSPLGDHCRTCEEFDMAIAYGLR